MFSYSVSVNILEKKFYKACTIQLNYKLAKDELCNETFVVVHSFILITNEKYIITQYVASNHIN